MSSAPRTILQCISSAEDEICAVSALIQGACGAMEIAPYATARPGALGLVNGARGAIKRALDHFENTGEYDREGEAYRILGLCVAAAAILQGETELKDEHGVCSKPILHLLETIVELTGEKEDSETGLSGKLRSIRHELEDAERRVTAE